MPTDEVPRGDPAPPRRWVDAAEHVTAYRATAGAVGHTWAGRPHLLLGTTGRRTGREHTVPLVYARLPEAARGSSLVVAASAGGAEQHPAWFLNLRHDPDVVVQLLGQRWGSTAQVADGSEAEAAWQALIGTWSGFARYRERTARRIPVVLLEDHPPGPPVPRPPSGPDDGPDGRG